MEEVDHNLKPPNIGRVRFRFYAGMLLAITPLFVLSVGLLVMAVSPSTNLSDDWKEVFLVFGTGIITLTSAFLGASFESRRERDREYRQARRERVREYREYLIDLWKLAQMTQMETEFLQRGDPIANEFAKASRSKLTKMINTLPLYGQFSTIEMEECRLAVDDAIEVGLRYWLQGDGDQPSDIEIHQSIVNAIAYLDFYETQI